MTGSTPDRVVVAVTGATGAGLALRCLQLLGRAGVERHGIVTPAGRRMCAHEIPEARIAEELDVEHHWRDVAAPLASGSFRTTAMLVVPCSARSLMAFAWGGDSTLVARAADVTLKERRRLVLAVRETPLHLGHTRAMVAVTEMGAVVAPPVPAFYFRPTTVEDLIDDMAYRLIDLCGIDLPDRPVWDGLPDATRRRDGACF